MFGGGLVPSSLGSQFMVSQNELVARGADRQVRRLERWADPERVLIYGVTGRARTLGRQIGEITGLRSAFRRR